MEDIDTIKEDHKIESYTNFTNSSTTTTNVSLSDLAFTSGTLTTSNNNLVLYTGSGTNSNYINLNQDFFKKGFINNLLDKIIEIKSLINKNEYEFFNIKKIVFGPKKSKIICEKKIDLNYIDDLKKQSELLLECIDNSNINYKQKAIKHNESLSNSWILYSGTNNINWTTNPGTITIGNDALGTNNFNWICTYNTGNITFTS